MDLKLSGKRALVTGGSRGIGRAIALALAAEGARVVAGYRNEGEAVASLEREFKAAGDGQLVQADLSDPAGATHLIEECRSRLGGLDIIVNNAGAMSHTPYDKLTPEEWQRLIATNLTGVHLVIQQALPILADGSSIINVGSGLALVGMPARAHYTASKAGVIGLSRSLAKELGKRGIRVNVIAPGIIETDLVSGLTEEGRRRYESLASLGRLGQPADVANVALFLASDMSGYISGATLPVDGGI